jgi:hypothetical protein
MNRLRNPRMKRLEKVPSRLNSQLFYIFTSKLQVSSRFFCTRKLPIILSCQACRDARQARMDTAVITNTITAAFAALQLLPRGAPFVPAMVNFAHTPAQARANLLDYENNPGNAKIFAKAAAPLLTMFVLSKPNVTILVSEVQTRSKTSLWGMLMVLTINAINLNFLDSYRRLTLPEL